MKRNAFDPCGFRLEIYEHLDSNSIDGVSFSREFDVIDATANAMHFQIGYYSAFLVSFLVANSVSKFAV